MSKARGLYRRSGISPCPEEQLNYNQNSALVKAFRIRYNEAMLKEEKLLKALLRNKLTLSIAESCTGGLLSHRITNIPGSSKVFLLGITAYSNEFKNKILKVPLRILREKGAVSYQTAWLMAQNIRKLARADFGVGITGIAGPTGQTKDKPIGTVFIAVSSSRQTIAEKFSFKGNHFPDTLSGSRLCREEIKRKAADKAMDMLLRELTCLPNRQ